MVGRNLADCTDVVASRIVTRMSHSADFDTALGMWSHSWAAVPRHPAHTVLHTGTAGAQAADPALAHMAADSLRSAQSVDAVRTDRSNQSVHEADTNCPSNWT